MSTYKVRVEDKIGNVGDDTALSDFLTAGAKFIVNILPLERVEKFTTDLTDAGSGISVTTSRVLRAHKSSYGARVISSGLAAQAVDSNSIHYASTTDPVFYISNGLGYVKPSGGTVVAMAYPTVAFGDSTITAFPIDLDEGVVLYACVHGRLRQMSDLTITTLGGLSISTFVKPNAPATPSFTYTDALADVMSSATVSFSDTISYTPPVFSGSFTNTDTALTNQDIELANAHLGKVNTQLDQYQKDLLVTLNNFNSDKAEFDANLQIALTNAQATQQKLMQEAQLTTDINKQNEAKELERQISEYASQLQKYGQEMNGYSLDVNQEVSRVSTRVSQYNAQFQQYALGLAELRKDFELYMKAI